MPYVVGLTGGIASGKTTVADLFHQHFNIDIVDADIIARQVVEPNTAGLGAIVEKFGTDILLPDGTLDRRQLRERIFAAPHDKQWLNETLHPLIRAEMAHQVAQSQSSYVLLVVPLLVEGGLQSMTDCVLVVDVDEETQLSRTMERDKVSREQALNIVNSQANRQERLAIADEIIKNNSNTDSLLPQIEALHAKFVASSKNRQQGTL
ncbi:dephospho-CoA kinase [Vibrio agarivorans]|uniref:dephospho-CoA kinase n=1 Tax=Vibrio agarivorans TaxID=153622 RepID=UPI002231B3EA|nr:dephospho-CoA kinase [Vibrio agarivorans]MDN3662453.1 dephospho-CoA kinase [Vibrio agarivorans]